ncbi:hypothetical protein AALP_AA1G268200 [Arabis alpina]|uniref:Replication protein A 70 kDa DNA-binding subunit B/D first OB fold domain-containing protein n=1 Tax=Arabis alpina TaxID=50452 RepID=A0A087HQX5_ARAAL|nr:hypothetical protein AALP_AA1G268200 [Arabis alpina]
MYKVQFTAESLAPEVQNSIPSSITRESPYLTHPIFNMYHTDHELLRYIHKLQSKDLSLCHIMIPLGSCTMKLNATTEMMPVTWPSFTNIHPFAPVEQAQVCWAYGYPYISYVKRGTSPKCVHHTCFCTGANPVSAAMCGMKIVAVGTDAKGNINIEELRKASEANKDNLAALMYVEWSANMMEEEAKKKLKAAELQCKKNKVKMWANYVPPASNSKAIHYQTFTGKCIVVRILRTWEARDFRRNNALLSVSCLLVNEKNNSIQASIHPRRLHKFKNKLKEGSIFSVTSFNVQPNLNCYRLSDNPYKIWFNDHTDTKESTYQMLLHKYHVFGFQIKWMKRKLLLGRPLIFFIHALSPENDDSGEIVPQAIQDIVGGVNPFNSLLNFVFSLLPCLAVAVASPSPPNPGWAFGYPIGFGTDIKKFGFIGTELLNPIG